MHFLERLEHHFRALGLAELILKYSLYVLLTWCLLFSFLVFTVIFLWMKKVAYDLKGNQGIWNIWQALIFYPPSCYLADFHILPVLQCLHGWHSGNSESYNLPFYRVWRALLSHPIQIIPGREPDSYLCYLLADWSLDLTRRVAKFCPTICTICCSPGSKILW